jgi:hypothetical protein
MIHPVLENIPATTTEKIAASSNPFLALRFRIISSAGLFVLRK